MSIHLCICHFDNVLSKRQLTRTAQQVIRSHECKMCVTTKIQTTLKITHNFQSYLNSRIGWWMKTCLEINASTVEKWTIHIFLITDNFVCRKLVLSQHHFHFLEHNGYEIFPLKWWLANYSKHFKLFRFINNMWCLSLKTYKNRVS